MSSEARKVIYVISDLHLGAGVYSSWKESMHEMFKSHPVGRDFRDTSEDEVLDPFFHDFIHWIVSNHQGDEVCLKLLGDIFDPLAVELDGRADFPQYEEDDVLRLQKIAIGHHSLIEALRFFCGQPNCSVEFIVGNHDLFLAWPGVQTEVQKLISQDHPDRVQFFGSLAAVGVYYEHGATEPHNRFDLDLRKNILEEGDPRSGEVKRTLDVTQGHYLSRGLANPLMLVDFLIERMHIHGFVWLDVLLHPFRRPWYRCRASVFVLVAAYHLFKIFIFHSLSTLRHMRTKSGFMKILKVLWWTITGAIGGTTTKARAERYLREHDETDVVVLGHEHSPGEELLHIGNRPRKYFNVGAWIQMWERRAPSPSMLTWKRLRRLQGFLFFFRDLFQSPELVSITLFPVLVVSHDDNGERGVRFMRWDSESKEIKDFTDR